MDNDFTPQEEEDNLTSETLDSIDARARPSLRAGRRRQRDQESERVRSQQPFNADETFGQTRPGVCLKADGTVDYLALTLNAIIPLAWNAYVLYLHTKKIPGGITAIVENSATPEQAMERSVAAINVLKETLSASRSV